jgi:zinc protease
MPNVSFAALEAEIDAEIARIAADGVTDAELDRAKTRLVADAIYAQDNQSTLARYYGATLSVGGKVEDLQQWPQRIAAVEAQRLIDVAKAVLVEGKSVVGLLEGVA